VNYVDSRVSVSVPYPIECNQVGLHKDDGAYRVVTVTRVLTTLLYRVKAPPEQINMVKLLADMIENRLHQTYVIMIKYIDT
jgi:hypothetical protein